MLFAIKSKLVPLCLIYCYLTINSNVALASDILDLDELELLAKQDILEEIIVTARKRNESLQETPVVVSVFDAQKIDAFEVNNLDSLSTLEPTLTINAEAGGPANPAINLRGIQSAGINTFNDQAVSINIDGVQFSASQVLRAGQFDLERIQVLKGPQPLFFGKNSTGGIIVVDTAGPTEKYFSEIKLGYEFEAERKDITAIVAGPFAENIGGRFALNYLDTAGHYNNIWPGVAEEKASQYEQLMTRGTLTFDFDNFSATLKTTYSNREGYDSAFGEVYLCDDPISATTVGNVFDDCRLNRTNAHQDPLDSAFWNQSDSGLYRSDTPEFEYEILFSSLHLQHQITDNWVLNSVTGYSKFDNYNFDNLFPGAANFVIFRNEKFESISQEVRLTADFDTARYMIGVFADNRRISNLQTQTFIVANPDTYQQLSAESASVFSQAEFYLTDDLILSMGGRYVKETKAIAGENRTSGLHREEGTTIIPAGKYIYPVDRIQEENFSPEVTLTWKPEDNLVFYSAYKEAFKSGSFDADTVDVARNTVGRRQRVDFLSETVDGFEAGAKMQFLDDTLRVNLTAFNYRYQDLQLVQYDPVTVSNRTVNAGSSTVKGLEVDITYLTHIDGLILSSGIVRLDAAFDEYVGQCNDPQLNGFEQGCTIDADGDGDPDSQDRAGDSLRGAADWNITLGVNYDRAITSYVRFKGNLQAVWRDKYATDADAYRLAVQDAAWTVGLNFGVYAYDESWAVDLIGSNIFDETIVLTSGPSPGIGNADGTRDPYFATLNNPREIMVRLTIKPELF